MRTRLIIGAAALTMMIAGLPAGADNDELTTYEVTITNLAVSQPISPPVVVTHERGVHFWQRNRAASAGIVAIAEDGDPSVAVAELEGAPGVTDVVNVGQPLTRSGTVFDVFTDTVTIEIDAHHSDRLSLAGMLICTNDGFAGLDSVPVPNNGDSHRFFARAYDAGSEVNTERSEDIVDPCSALGPVALAGDPNGNENAAVDADGVIRNHRGIVGESDLLIAHNWRPRVLEVTISAD